MKIKNRRFRSGFTIVELLIVIVVIAILAAISIVAYSGIQQRARTVAVKSALSQAAKKVQLYHAGNSSVYPTTLADAGVISDTTISYTYTSDADGYCITTLYKGAMPMNIRTNGSISDGPCDGQSGGSEYCPANSFVQINGHYCDGNEGSIASLNTNAVKLSASASGVPANAPAAYVGRQSTRDNYLSSPFTVVAGDTYCIEGWVATTNSTVTHSLGLQVSGPSVSTGWTTGSPSSGYTGISPTSTWVKRYGCMLISAGYTTARVWSQNDGTNGSTADAYWYQTAIRFWKQ